MDRAIEVGQGTAEQILYLKLTTSVEEVARIGLKGMMKGRIRVIPGFSNKLLALAPRLLPTSLMLATMRRIQEQIRNKDAA